MISFSFVRCRFSMICGLVAVCATVAGIANRAAAVEIPDELRIKRETEYEFAEPPALERDGDRFRITFATTAYCDATVAIENAQGKIIRHLAYGVLGENAPLPFAKGTKRQNLLWDGKDDAGRYVDDLTGLSVRVSLGLKADFERNLYWSPHKRLSSIPIMAAAPEGVYVYEGFGFDQLRLFDHEGQYVRTVYPFPADKLEDVSGLDWHDFPQGYRLPLKQSLYQQTLLTSGTNDSTGDRLGMEGQAATGMAVRGDRIALAYENLNRLATDGTTGGLPLGGPQTGVEILKGGFGQYNKGKTIIGPSSMAFSPDGETLYMTGWLWQQRYGRGRPGSMHAVLSMKFDQQDEPTVFVGSRDLKEHGTDDAHFRVPTTVDTDAAGRVYVSDYLNDRVQVFDPAGKLVKSLAVEKPARVLVHQRTGEIFVFSWGAIGIPFDLEKIVGFGRQERGNIPHTLTRFSALPEGKRGKTEPFPLGVGDPGYIFAMGQVYQVELDEWSEQPTFWVVGRKHIVSHADVNANAAAAAKKEAAELWEAGIRLIRRDPQGEWKPVFEFGKQVEESVVRHPPPRNAIQQLYVDPTTGLVYLGEPDSGATWKAYKELLEIDPATGKIREVPLPFNALDVVFGPEGLIYLRTTDVVARYDMARWRETGEWREVPWDYGEELPKVTSGMYGRTASVVSGLVLPAGSPVCFHQGGMHVSSRGQLIVACHNRNTETDGAPRKEKQLNYGKPYSARLYPGRVVNSTACVLHVWDRHGKVLFEDAVPGIPQIDGVFLDSRSGIYVMATPTRIYDGQKYFDEMSETVMKFEPNEGKIVASKGAPITVDASARGDEKPQVTSGPLGKTWIEGVEWLHGGVGFAGFNTSKAGGGCACWHARFTVDYFGRSFAPAPLQYNVAVLDPAGNLVMRIGRYGNVDSSGAESRVPLGGDEIGLFHAAFVGTHTDHRLFISDVGNGRIVSARLGYHAERRVSLGDQ